MHANRRSFLKTSVAAGVGASLLSSASPAFARVQAGEVDAGDVAILRFLAAAEQVEDDLWQQYCELAVGNPRYNRALRRIDPSLVRYVCDDRDDERSHAALINAYLQSIGAEPVDLTPFRTLPSVDVPGADRSRRRLTNLRRLTVDTSWYERYRSSQNPDLGATFAQVVEIVDRPTVPVSSRTRGDDLQAIAHSAAFHFAAIEQGGGSLYAALIPSVTTVDALRILAAIGPTEIYHFAAFHKSLEGLFGLDAAGLSFPDLASQRDRAEAIFPEPCRFIPDLPLCSVIRPTRIEHAGPLAAATALARSGLFEGQSQVFFDAVTALATAAERAHREV